MLLCRGQLDGVASEFGQPGSAVSAFLAHEVAADRCRGFDDRIDGLTDQLSDLRSDLADYEDGLARPSLGRLLATLRGRRREALDDRQAKVDAARARVAAAETELHALRRERAAVLVRIRELAAAPEAYRAALADPARSSSEPDDPRMRRLL